MAEVKVRYNNSDIAAIQKPGGMTLQTAGKYMENNVEVQYTDPNPNVIQDQDDYIVLSDQAGVSPLGGLANMINVQTQNAEFAYMLMCMKNCDTKGGTVTYTSAFANTSTKILETGLTTIHGLLFVSARSINGGSGAGLCSSIFIFQTDTGTINATGWCGTNAAKVYGQAQGTVQAGSPLQGAITFTGGDVYYTGRYNKNTSYQLLSVNVEYEWLAW